EAAEDVVRDALEGSAQDVDHAASARGVEERQERLGEREGTDGVEREYRVVPVGGDARIGLPADIVHEHIEAVDSLARAAGEALVPSHRLVVRVEEDHVRAGNGAPKAVERREPLTGISAGHDHTRPPRGQAPRGEEAYAGGRPRDEDRLALHD